MAFYLHGGVKRSRGGKTGHDFSGEVYLYKHRHRERERERDGGRKMTR
jgi:hypothetical protein